MCAVMCVGGCSLACSDDMVVMNGRTYRRTGTDPLVFGHKEVGRWEYWHPGRREWREVQNYGKRLRLDEEVQSSG